MNKKWENQVNEEITLLNAAASSLTILLLGLELVFLVQVA